MKSRILLALLIIISSCEDKETITIDPLNGEINVFNFDGKIYNTTRGHYSLYDKIDNQFYYCFLIGTTNNYNFPKNVNESYVQYGDFVRIFVQADSLGKNNGSYDITANEYNVISISGKTEILKDGKITLKAGIGDSQIIEIDARTYSDKKLNLRADLSGGSIAYKIVRTVEGEFVYNSFSYDISEAFSHYNNTENKLTFAVQDVSETIGSQIIFFINKSSNTIPGTYVGSGNAAENNFTGFIWINDIINDSPVLQVGFNQGTLLVKQEGENYNISFDIKTSAGHAITGHYLGEIIK